MNTQKTNWKYLLIVITLTGFVGGFSIYYSFLTQKEIKKEIQIISSSKIFPKEEEKHIELPLEELKEGENKIGNIIVEKITPFLLCNSSERESFEEKKFIGYEYLGIIREGGYYELTCNIENKAKIKIVGYESSLHFIIENIVITDGSNNIINEYDGYFAVAVESFHHNDKTYFLIDGASGGTAGITEHFLYRIDNKGNIKFISSWGCTEEEYGKAPFKCKSYYELKYILTYKGNLYLIIEGFDEIWELDENDNIKNKFPANKIIIKDSEISFQ